jgi:UDP-N-acetylglucosamine 2-epimerase (non-hydrolysing)
MEAHALAAPLMVCIGTRPEAIKLAPVVQALERRGIPRLIVASGQHREMLDETLGVFNITPDIDLRLMRDRQTLAELTASAVSALDRVIASERPAALIVQGDTTTAMAAALAALYQQVPVAHVEAGLRTGVLANPFPEEANRRLLGQLATWHFCPTSACRANLLREGVRGDSVHVTGNTVIDAALSVAGSWQRADRSPRGQRHVLVTLHRRESHGEILRRISEAIARLAARPDVHVTFPVHRSPAVRESVIPVLGADRNVTLSEPFDYATMIRHLADADLVLTDSGGLQEEAPAFDIPVLVLRETTERPEGLAAGCSVLCGTDPERIFATASALLDDTATYARMARAENPYGDGRAAERIVGMLTDALAMPAARPAAAAI